MTREAKLTALLVPASWISRRTSSPTAVRRKFARHPQVIAILDSMRPGDELRWYCSPRAGWAHRVGVRGYVVVRDGELDARARAAMPPLGSRRCPGSPGDGGDFE